MTYPPFLHAHRHPRTSRLGVWLLALLAAPLAFGARPARADGPTLEPLSAFPQSLLSVRTAGGRVLNFKIWTADTPARREQGLMFQRHMDEHAGMLFLFTPERRVAMWMKNTYLPLDLLFIERDGRIAHIAHRAAPLSEDLIEPPGPVHAVLELNGGAAERFGIREGDHVSHPALSPR